MILTLPEIPENHANAMKIVGDLLADIKFDEHFSESSPKLEVVYGEGQLKAVQWLYSHSANAAAQFAHLFNDSFHQMGLRFRMKPCNERSQSGRAILQVLG